MNINDINNFSIKTFFSISVFLECDYLMNAHVSGLFSVIGLVVYPVGWGTKRVRDLCGEYADPYVIDSCSIGEFCTIFEFYVITKGVTSNNFTYISQFFLLSIEIISDKIFLTKSII